MVNMRPILLVIGILLVILSGAMVIAAIADVLVRSDDWKNFITSAFFTAFIGGGLILSNHQKSENLSIKQAFILTALSWVALVAFSALPFMLSEFDISYTDSFFEAMSGLTTTGATVLVGLDTMPPGLLLWRSMLQWFGGIGIIVMAMAVLPMLKIGGMQLFRTESSDKSDKILPRATQISGAIGAIYVLLTILCAVALWMAGMPVFDAICHAMTTIATAGFSTHDASIGYFDSVAIEVVMTVGMLAAAIPFVLYIQVLRGRPWALWRDTQVQWFFAIIVLTVMFATYWLHHHNHLELWEALRLASFNVVSIVTTSGFSSADYSQWGPFFVTAIFLLSVVGGCTGSTTGGIKIFRYQVLYETAKVQVFRLVQPHGVFMPLFNRKPISDVVSSSVLSFFILFAFCFTVLALLLSATGLDFVTSMSAAAASLANLGPGLGDIVGPAGNYSSLSDAAKWLLTAGMLIGRLEIFTVLILFSNYFWRS